MLASALRPDGDAAAVFVLRDTPNEVLLAAPTVDEVLDGLWRKAPEIPGFAALANWWSSEVLGQDGLRILVPDAAALVAGARVRARRHLPPTGPSRRRRKDRDSRRDGRASWRADIQIAAIAWRHGLPVATRNRADFGLIADILAALYPAQDVLRVVDPWPPAGAT
jgi:predicted nucleic acid-binding protein